MEIVGNDSEYALSPNNGPSVLEDCKEGWRKMNFSPNTCRPFFVEMIILRHKAKLLQASMCGPLLKFLVLRHAAACFYLHMWVPTHLWEIELTNKRQHAQHCWAEFITFTIRIVCSGFVDIHHSQMAQKVVAHMQTILCLDGPSN